METIREILRLKILELPGIIAGRSRFGGNEAFFLGKREIAHFHVKDEIDISITKQFAAQYIGLPQAIPGKRPSDWMALRLENDKDIALAVKMVKKAIMANSE